MKNASRSKRVEESWTIIGEEFHDAWPTKDEAEEWAKANPPEGKWRIARMVERDSAVEAVVKALVNTRDSMKRLEAAVVRFENSRKRKP